MLTRLSVKMWFCVAVAMIGAAFADPLVEFASNRGMFGAGTFTDRSNWAVLPALVVGLTFVALHLILRIRSQLVNARDPAPAWARLALRTVGARVAFLVPLIFALQLLALFTIETFEQVIVYGHPLGGLLWLGGPLAASLAVHAFTCIAVAFVASRFLRALAEATVRLVHIVRAFATLQERAARAIFLRRPDVIDLGRPLRVHCCIGERAPPILAA
jgi:hypothetical protein